MNLNFEILTLKTGFEVQGHIIICNAESVGEDGEIHKQSQDGQRFQDKNSTGK